MESESAMAAKTLVEIFDAGKSYLRIELLRHGWMGFKGRVYFRGGWLLNRRTIILYSLKLFLLGFEALLAPVILFLALPILSIYPFWDAVIQLCGLFGPILPALPIILLPVIVFLWRLESKLSTVEVLDGAFSMGGRIVSPSDIEDLRIATQSYEDIEVEGGPVIGYGLHGYGYGYTPSRTATRLRTKYPLIQLFRKDGVIEEISLSPREFWPFMKAVLKSGEHLEPRPEWMRRLEKLSSGWR